MKIRRIAFPNQQQICSQILENGKWIDAPQKTQSPFNPAWEYAQLQYRNDELLQLPFQPLSFRDFMLYEKHAIDAARGYVKRFMPKAYRVTSLYESFTGKTFPRFKPEHLWYEKPIYYMGNHLAFVPSGSRVQTPKYSKALDYELELGFVLDKHLFNATPEEAENAIGGFVVLNDFSARDVQRAEMTSGFGPQKSKHFLSSMSDVMVTADEILPQINELKGAVYINNTRVSSVSTAGMRYSLGQVLAHASRDEHLFPGELFGTGTLPGGSGMENGHWLKSGDQLRLTIDGIGEIQHQIV